MVKPLTHSCIGKGFMVLTSLGQMRLFEEEGNIMAFGSVLSQQEDIYQVIKCV